MNKKIILIIIFLTLIIPSQICISATKVKKEVPPLDNRAPYVTEIKGPRTASPSEYLYYFFNATDPDGDDIYYTIKWGDGQVRGPIGPYRPNGSFCTTHTYNKKRPYVIMCKVEDSYGAESDWKTFSIIISKNRIISRSLQSLLQNYPILSQILQRF